MKLLDVVATLADVPASHLAKGQVGNIVNIFILRLSNLIRNYSGASSGGIHANRG
jgi:hypothetical protein